MPRTIGSVLSLYLVAGVMLGCENTPKTVSLVVSNHNPAGTSPSMAIDFWAEEVAKQSRGRIRFDIHHDAKLMSEEAVLKGVQTGVADIGLYVLDAVDGFVLNTFVSLPFLGWPGQRDATCFYEELLTQFPEMNDEWGNATILSVSMMPGTHMHFQDVDVTTPSDLDDLRLMGAEVMTADAVEAAGAIPVQLDIGEMNAALDSRTIDGVINHFPALDVFGTLEKTNYHLVFGKGGINMTPIFLIMNSDVLNNLEDDLIALLLDSRDIWQTKILELSKTDEVRSRQTVDEAGHTVTELSPDEVAVWREEIAQPVHDEWIAAAVADGLPGQAVYDELTDLLQ